MAEGKAELHTWPILASMPIKWPQDHSQEPCSDDLVKI